MIGTAYYDLARSPPTFNHFDFLLCAEIWRRDCGLDQLSVKVLPGPVEGFRDDKLPPYGGAERMRWLENIVLPMAALLPSCGVPSFLVDRDQAGEGEEFGRGQGLIGPKYMFYAAQRGVAPFRAIPTDFAKYRHRYGLKLVTITLRNTGWWIERTSNLAEWLTVARELEAAGFTVVFVPDGTNPHLEIPGFRTEPAASLNIAERAGLYQAALMNLGIANGPMWFSWFMGVPTLIFKIVNENEPAARASVYRDAGLEPGRQLANSRAGQRLIWAADDADIILKAFEQHSPTSERLTDVG